VTKNIYERSSGVRPSSLVAVAERRFDDAVALHATGENARANGAQYLAGLTVEILLKAQLMREFPTIAARRPHEVSGDQRPVWNLIWRSHDLSAMLDQLAGLRAGMSMQGNRAGIPYLDWLRGICGLWTIYIRYSTATSTIAESRELLDRVRHLKEVMK